LAGAGDALGFCAATVTLAFGVATALDVGFGAAASFGFAAAFATLSLAADLAAFFALASAGFLAAVDLDAAVARAPRRFPAQRRATTSGDCFRCVASAWVAIITNPSPR